MTKHSSLKENNKLNKFCQWASSTIDKNQAASSYQYHSSLSLSLKIARRLESSTLLRIPSGFCDDPLWRKKNKLTMFLQLEDISKEYSHWQINLNAVMGACARKESMQERTQQEYCTFVEKIV